MRLRRVYPAIDWTDSPSTLTVPRSGSMSRLIILRSVVLPEPESPTSATKVRAGILKVTSRTAKSRPSSNDFDTPSKAIMRVFSGRFGFRGGQVYRIARKRHNHQTVYTRRGASNEGQTP